MTRSDQYRIQQEVAARGVLLGPVGEVKEAIRRVMDATEQFTAITARYTGGEKQGQTYRGAWKLHNANALVAEADRKRAANPDRDDLLTVFDPNRDGWRSIRVDSIQSITVHTAPGVAVTVPVVAYRP